MLESGQGVTLAIEEGGTREQAVTFLATWQGVLWHSVAAPAEGVHVTLYHHLPSAPLLLHSAPDRQIFILYVLIQILLNANANSEYGIRNYKSHAFDVSFCLMWVDSLTFLSPYRIFSFSCGRPLWSSMHSFSSPNISNPLPQPLMRSWKYREVHIQTRATFCFVWFRYNSSYCFLYFHILTAFSSFWSCFHEPSFDLTLNFLQAAKVNKRSSSLGAA